MKIKPQITKVLAAVAATAVAILPFDEPLLDSATGPGACPCVGGGGGFGDGSGGCFVGVGGEVSFG